MNEMELLEIYNKFPVVLRHKLINSEVVFPDKTMFSYEQFKAFRGILREPEDHTPLNVNDMKSYFEEGKKPRGSKYNENDPSIYSVSLFRRLEDFANVFKFPKPGKKVAHGYVFMEGGPQLCSETSSHVDWWLFENVDLSNFVIREDLNG